MKGASGLEIFNELCGILDVSDKCSADLVNSMLNTSINVARHHLLSAYQR